MSGAHSPPSDAHESDARPFAGVFEDDRFRERFEVLDALGQGGMGALFVARDRALDRRVALKMTLVSDAMALGRFEREGQLLARLSHPRLLKVFAAEVFAGVPVLVMELLDGVSLATELAHTDRYSLARALETTDQILDALDAVHAQGIVHRDLKPANVLCVDGGIKVIDFGIARSVAGDAFASSLTAAGVLLGTPAYMSPEQCLGLEAGAWVDLYATGVMLFEMLTGRLPFQGEQLADILHAHVEAPVPPVRRFAPDIPATVEAVIMRALAKQPVDRYTTAARMRAALTAVGQDSRVRARDLPVTMAAPDSHARPGAQGERLVRDAAPEASSPAEPGTSHHVAPRAPARTERGAATTVTPGASKLNGSRAVTPWWHTPRAIAAGAGVSLALVAMAWHIPARITGPPGSPSSDRAQAPASAIGPSVGRVAMAAPAVFTVPAVSARPVMSTVPAESMVPVMSPVSGASTMPATSAVSAPGAGPGVLEPPRDVASPAVAAAEFAPIAQQLVPALEAIAPESVISKVERLSGRRSIHRLEDLAQEAPSGRVDPFTRAAHLLRASTGVAGPWLAGAGAADSRDALLKALLGLEVVDVYMQRQRLRALVRARGAGVLGPASHMVPTRWDFATGAGDLLPETWRERTMLRDDPRSPFLLSRRVPDVREFSARLDGKAHDERTWRGDGWCGAEFGLGEDMGEKANWAAERDLGVAGEGSGKNRTDLEIVLNLPCGDTLDGATATLACRVNDLGESILWVSINGHTAIPFCAPRFDGALTMFDHADHVRQFPACHLRPGRNVLSCRIRPYPGADRTTVFYLSALAIVIDLERAVQGVTAGHRSAVDNGRDTSGSAGTTTTIGGDGTGGTAGIGSPGGMASPGGSASPGGTVSAGGMASPGGTVSAGGMVSPGGTASSGGTVAPRSR